jgi:hypothetical protein
VADVEKAVAPAIRDRATVSFIFFLESYYVCLLLVVKDSKHTERRK